MHTDPIIEDVRRARRQIESECCDDPRRVFAFLKAGEAANAKRLVSYGKPAPTSTAPGARPGQ